MVTEHVEVRLLSRLNMVVRFTSRKLRGARLWGVCVILSLLSSCKKDPFLWQADYVFPIAHGKIHLQDIIQDKYLEESADHSLTFIFSDTLFELSLDTLLNTPDTSLIDSFQWTFGGFTLLPNQTLFSGEKESKYQVKNIELKKLKVRSGKVYFAILNTVDEKLLVEYALPTVKKDGQSILITKLVEPGIGNNISQTLDSIDLSGYDIDLTGEMGNKVNVLFSTYSIKTNPNGSPVLINNGDKVKIITTLHDLIPAYGSGYLGSEISTYNAREYFDDFKNISGFLDLESVSLDLKIQNALGVDARFTLNQLASKNTKTNTMSVLSSPWIGQAVNINRANDQIPGFGPVNYSEYQMSFHPSSSNLDELIEIFPDSLMYDLQFELNPLGNVSASSDFVYLDQKTRLLTQIKVPLQFSAQDILISDTLRLNISESARKTLLKTKQATLYAFIQNLFPAGAQVSLHFIDQKGDSLAFIAEHQEIKAADNMGGTPQEILSMLTIPLDQTGIENLLKAEAVMIKGLFYTSGLPSKTIIYSSQFLDVQLSLDVSQYIP